MYTKRTLAPFIIKFDDCRFTYKIKSGGIFLISILFFLFISTASFSQHIKIETQIFNEENGLSSYANYIHKDNRGLIWVGTQYGLYRYNGKGFIHFDEKNGLPFREIMEIYEDDDGWFWLFKSCFRKPNCKKDLAFFHPITKEVQTFEERFGEKLSVKPEQIESIAQDAQNNIFLTADRKIISYSENGITEFQIQEAKRTPHLWKKVTEDLFGVFFFENSNNRDRFDFTGNFTYAVIDINGKIRQPPNTFQIPETSAGKIYMLKKYDFEFQGFRFNDIEVSFASNGALKIDTLPFQLLCCPEIFENYYSDEQLFSDSIGQLFHAELGQMPDLESRYIEKIDISKKEIAPGLNIFWLKRKSEERINAPFQQIAVNIHRHSYFDHVSNNTWRAGRNGIKIINFRSQFFRQIRKPENQNHLAAAALKIADQSVLLSIQTNLFQYAPPGMLRIVPASFPIKRRIKSLSLEKGDTDFWAIGNVYLWKINLSDFSFTKIALPYADEKFQASLKSGNSLWIGGGAGILKYKIDRDSFYEYNQYNQFEALKSSKIHFFKKADESHLWIGSDSGIYFCSEKTGILARYNSVGEGDNYLPALNFFHMSEAKEGGFWLATGSGLLHWNPPATTNSLSVTDSLYRLFNSDTGLKTNEILAAYEDDFGFVWMPTPHGLIQFQTATGLSKVYLRENGLSSEGFQEYAHCQTEDGTLYLGGYQGFNVFHPRDFKDVKFNPEIPLVITEFEQHRDATDKIENLLKSVIDNKEIVLEPGDKFFNLRVNLVDYRDAKKQQFSYKIEGYREDWQEDESNLIRISGLPYGNFVLKIKGRLYDGQYSAKQLSVPIRVLKPFYLKNWFLISVVLGIMVFIFSFFRYRTEQYKSRQKELEKTVFERTKVIEQQKEELQKLDKVKSRFFANVTHELKTPLTLILGPIQTLMKSGNLNEKEKIFADLVGKNASNLLNLVNEMLDLTKMESGKIQLQNTSVEFIPFLQQLTEVFDGRAVRKGIQYQFLKEVDPSLKIVFDENKVKKIMNNLLSNAFKFTPANGKITLAAIDKGDRLLISVSDTGRGIHPDDLPRIFDRYFQSTQLDIPKEGGTGLGLALSLEFAKLLKGELWAESVLGEGSTFYFEFPKIVSEGDPVAETEELRKLPTPADSEIDSEGIPSKNFNSDNTEEILHKIYSEKPTILLVEDTDNLREYIRIILSEKFEVITAENGSVAWEYLTADGRRQTVDGSDSAIADRPASGVRRLPSLIISDIMMPEMDGYQLLEKLKPDDRFRGIPVVMLTALSELKDKLRALRIGVDDYMTKPFHEDELIARVENLLINNYHRKLYQSEPEEAQGNGLKEIETEPSKSSKLGQEELLWLEELESVVKLELTNFHFNVDILSRKMAMSKRGLERKSKQLTGMSPGKYIQEVRLHQARFMLENKTKTSIKAIVYSVGVKDPVHFSRQFRARFGRLPSEYLR